MEEEQGLDPGVYGWRMGPHLEQLHGLDEGVEEGVEAVHHVHDLVGLWGGGEQQERANGAQTTTLLPHEGGRPKARGAGEQGAQEEVTTARARGSRNCTGDTCNCTEARQGVGIRSRDLPCWHAAKQLGHANQLRFGVRQCGARHGQAHLQLPAQVGVAHNICG